MERKPKEQRVEESRRTREEVLRIMKMQASRAEQDMARDFIEQMRPHSKATNVIDTVTEAVLRRLHAYQVSPTQETKPAWLEALADFVERIDPSSWLSGCLTSLAQPNKTSYGAVGRWRPGYSRAFGGIHASRPSFGGIRAAFGGQPHGVAPPSATGTFEPHDIGILGGEYYPRLGAIAIEGDTTKDPGEDAEFSLTFRPNAQVKWAVFVFFVQHLTIDADGNTTAVVNPFVPTDVIFAGTGDTNQVTGGTSATPGNLSPSQRDPTLVASISKENPFLFNGRVEDYFKDDEVPELTRLKIVAALTPIAEAAAAQLFGRGG